MTAPKGYLFSYYGNVYHIVADEDTFSPVMALCGSWQALSDGRIYTNLTDGRLVCHDCNHEAKRKGLK